jgi:hypothetical protein
MTFDATRPWYHGSPLKLTVLRAGSTMTQWRSLARAFSHKPAILMISDDRQIRHTGTLPGYLYEIAEPVAAADVVPHPRTTMEGGDEWLTTRNLRLTLIGETQVNPAEVLTDAEVARLRAGQHSEELENTD